MDNSKPDLTPEEWEGVAKRFLPAIRQHAHAGNGLDGRRLDAGQEALMRAVEAVREGRCAATVPAALVYARVAYHSAYIDLLRAELGEVRTKDGHELRDEPYSLDQPLDGGEGDALVPEHDARAPGTPWEVEDQTLARPASLAGPTPRNMDRTPDATRGAADEFTAIVTTLEYLDGRTTEAQRLRARQRLLVRQTLRRVANPESRGHDNGDS